MIGEMWARIPNLTVKRLGVDYDVYGRAMCNIGDTPKLVYRLSDFRCPAKLHDGTTGSVRLKLDGAGWMLGWDWKEEPA